MNQPTVIEAPTVTEPAFAEFPKLARLSREIVITEKIDGTNAQIFIAEVSNIDLSGAPVVAVVGNLAIFAGSRTRSIVPGDDNYGFAAWVKENAEQLAALGPGRHFGEWWGQGIQRKYDLTEKRFSLFNTGRWAKFDSTDPVPPLEGQEYCPPCCHVVPVLYTGPFDTNNIENVLWKLREFGSVAAPGFKRPEGIVIYHSAARIQFKKTLEKDEKPKSQVASG